MTSKPAARKAATKYSLKFVPDAWREWQALDGSIKQVLKPLLAKRLQNPHVSDRELAAVTNGVSRDDALWASTRKIKLLKQGYRLVYMVEDGELVVLVLSVGKRADSAAYALATKRIK
jgi:mRNA interferase RelE/StbE